MKKSEVPLLKLHGSHVYRFRRIHSCDQHTQPPLNDNSGNELASVLLSLKATDLMRLIFRGNQAGTCVTV